MSSIVLRLFVLLLVAGAAGCSPRGDLAAPGTAPPVVLISVDTLRADHLPAYGYGGVETPAFDTLAAGGVVFERAWSHYPLTLPSHASMFSGLLPPRHGVRDNSGYRLAPDAPHLARDLSAAGYATGGAVSAFVLRGETGLGDGFDLYDDAVPLRRRTGMGGQQRAGDATLDAVLPWLRRAAADHRRGGPPFFLFLHLYEPHTPYAPPERFAGRSTSAYDGEIAAADAVVGRLLAELRRLGVYEEALVILTSDHGEGLGDHGEAEHGVLLYREALHVPLIVKPPRQPAEGRAGAIHGAAPGGPTKEGGWPAAGARVRVPAMLADVHATVMEAAGADRERSSGPGMTGGRRSGGASPGHAAGSPAAMLDVGAGLLGAWAGRSGEAAAKAAGDGPSGDDFAPGVSLRALADADSRAGHEPRAVYAETFYPRLHFGWSELTSVVRGDLHLVAGPRPELFDLAADPGETRDLVRERRRDYAALRRVADELAVPLAAPGTEDAETRRRLAALGYLGGDARSGDGPLPDPRQRLPVLAELEAGMRLAAVDRFAEAAGRLGRVTAAEPGMVDAWEALARAHRGAGEPGRALEAYRRALSLAPGAPQLALGAAAVLLELERPAEAAEHARLATDELPVEAAEVLVRAALAAGDPAAAARHAGAAVAAEPAAAAAHLLVAEARAAAGELEAALATLDRAAALHDGGGAGDGAGAGRSGGGAAAPSPAPAPPPLLGLDRLRGHVLARLGRPAEAEAAFEREIASFPGEPRAYTELALLHALRGRPQAAVATLRRLVADADTPRGYLAASRALRVLGDPAGAAALRRHGAERFPDSPALATEPGEAPSAGG